MVRDLYDRFACARCERETRIEQLHEKRRQWQLSTPVSVYPGISRARSKQRFPRDQFGPLLWVSLRESLFLFLQYDDFFAKRDLQGACNVTAFVYEIVLRIRKKCRANR